MPDGNYRVLCFAHLGWGFAYQRPQHVMVRLAQRHRTIYWEEPVRTSGIPTLAIRCEENVTVATPQLPSDASYDQCIALQRALLDDFLTRNSNRSLLLWYYTPMALEFSRHLTGLRVYDCMDELSAFKNAPPSMRALERELLQKAAVVFTGGRSLYYAKRHANPNVHCLPSAVDAEHFRPARRAAPKDLQPAQRPCLGFYGVIDERFDTAFVDELARQLHDWQLFFIGPVVKVDPNALPRGRNIHYLGPRPYEALPAYLEHWDIALLPFALNDATRFISPTKTLEYLAARKPVISTPIADVVEPYGAQKMVHIARTGSEAAEMARAIYESSPSQLWHDAIDRVVAGASWNSTVGNMERLLAVADVAPLRNVG